MEEKDIILNEYIKYTSSDNVLVRLRKERGWTLERLAQEVHVNPLSISRLERAMRGCTLKTVRALAEALGVSFDELTQGTVRYNIKRTHASTRDKGGKVPKVGTLSAYRAAAGLTVKDLAAKLGVSPMTVSRWENGSTAPKTPMQLRIAETLGCKVEDLGFGGHSFDYTYFAYNFRRLKAEQGWSYPALSVALGLEPVGVVLCHFANGQRRPGFELLDTMCKVFGCTLDDLQRPPANIEDFSLPSPQYSSLTKKEQAAVVSAAAEKGLIPVKEYAARIGKPRPTVLQAVHFGRLKTAQKISGRWFVSPDEPYPS